MQRNASNTQKRILLRLIYQQEKILNDIPLYHYIKMSKIDIQGFQGMSILGIFCEPFLLKYQNYSTLMPYQEYILQNQQACQRFYLYTVNYVHRHCLLLIQLILKCKATSLQLCRSTYGENHLAFLVKDAAQKTQFLTNAKQQRKST